jgi:hypothetical protein
LEAESAAVERLLVNCFVEFHQNDPVLIGREEEPLITGLAQLQKSVANFNETLENLIPKVEFSEGKGGEEKRD